MKVSLAMNWCLVWPW